MVNGGIASEVVKYVSWLISQQNNGLLVSRFSTGYT
jgi:hypothetical protein